MWAMISRVAAAFYFDEARRLGNPEKPLFSAPDPLVTSYHGISIFRQFLMPSVTSNTAEQGATGFTYQVDWSKFDNGYLIFVEYKRNENWEDFGSLENQILLRNTHMSARDFNQIILPVILPLKSYVTHVEFYTRNGKPYISLKAPEEISDFPFFDIPSILDMIPRVHISQLRQPKNFCSDYRFIDVVIYMGHLYTFKHHPIYPDKKAMASGDKLLDEVIYLSRYSSPFILKCPYIITDDNPRGKFRGYLQPFLPAGCLLDVLKSVKKHRDRIQSSSEVPQPRQPLESSPTNSVETSQFDISWVTKHRWCIDMISGVLALHNEGSYIGYITPGNFLLDKEGGIKLIDISPGTRFNVYYSPPEVITDGLVNLDYTGPRDVFSMGLVFWVLAEELLEFDREWPTVSPTISWTNGRNSAPLWFRTLVEDCIKTDPTERPSADNILNILKANLMK
ncbi:hypothetical protein HYPSUDRAFT_40814 [Hypholoma sublateritium FD-334 SS-4]|uniref:Protein kinase domain-containing protein n=1 Tax=Hypholoma sublateritium (strain FD-334 SS-4) TaxID=945553 RepID=A0A0D2MGH9_HYPSF|nr:hypothetical protein HYPSUDRAFT_40814 [Hypholoma sublateritium FD-334 SS-4]